jgi:rhamnogalacturonyl hydrolase YesR
VCHGTAGAGLGQIRFWEQTGREEFLDRTRLAADTLAGVVRRRDGLARWPIPDDLASRLAGAVRYDFAHGVAGVGAFLLAAAQATGEPRYRALACAAADTLVAVAHREAGGAYWTSGEQGGPLRTQWCNGSSGVGTFLLRAWQHTGDDRYGELAAEAAVAVRRTRWHAGTAQCHGLAGDAEFLLDLAEAGAPAAGVPAAGTTGAGPTRAGVRADATPYREWARELLTGIYIRGVLRGGRLLVPDESAVEVVPDFNTGLSGVLALLLRMRDGGPRMWLPEALTRPAPP